MADRSDGYDYGSNTECIDVGMHGVSTDDDGFCFGCGYHSSDLYAPSITSGMNTPLEPEIKYPPGPTDM